MSGKENIIASILKDAEDEKARILAEAQKSVDEIIAEDKNFQKKNDALKNDEIAEGDVAILSRRRSVAELDVRKIVLQKKQQKMTEVFQKAKESIVGADKQTYLNFITNILRQYAEDGDTVVVSKAEKRRITAKFIEEFATNNHISLSYRANGEFVGGILLEGIKCDKNLTLDMLLKEYREDNESRISKILFGE